MGSFGENIRREREMRGISLEEISLATRISVRMLEAIETECLERLPGGVFNRSFVRQYARYLGLDEDRVVAEFELACGASPEPVDFKRLASTASGPSGWSAEPEEPEPRSYEGWVFATLLGLAVLAFSGWRLWTAYATRAMPSSRPAGALSPARPSAPVEQPSQPSASQPADAAGGGTAAPAAEASPEPALRLQVDAMDRSWVAVFADGRKVWEAELEPGASRGIAANRSVELRVGNAAALVLTLNGETLPPLGRKGEVKTVTYTAADLAKHSSAGSRP